MISYVKNKLILEYSDNYSIQTDIPNLDPNL